MRRSFCRPDPFERRQLLAGFQYRSDHCAGDVISRFAQLRLFDCGYIFWAVAISAGLPGVQIRLLPKNPGRFVDDCMFWLSDPVFYDLSFPAYQALATPGLAVVTLAELAFALWLLIKGAKLPE